MALVRSGCSSKPSSYPAFHPHFGWLCRCWAEYCWNRRVQRPKISLSGLFSLHFIIVSIWFHFQVFNISISSGNHSFCFSNFETGGIFLLAGRPSTTRRLTPGIHHSCSLHPHLSLACRQQLLGTALGASAGPLWSNTSAMLCSLCYKAIHSVSARAERGVFVSQPMLCPVHPKNELRAGSWSWVGEVSAKLGPKKILYVTYKEWKQLHHVFIVCIGISST